MPKPLLKCKCGCGGDVKSYGALYCKGHFSRFRRHGAKMPTRDLICRSCSRPFQRRYGSASGNEYCTHACYVQHKRTLSGFLPSQRNCEQCQKDYTASIRNPKQRFCSKECFDNSRRIYSAADITCAGCGARTSLRRGRGRNRMRRFCSHPCYLRFRGEKSGSTKARRNPKKQHNAYLLKRPQVCQICGFDRYVEWAHLIPVREGGSAASVNIVILCPNHHRLFDTNQLLPEEQEIIDALRAVAVADPLSKVSLRECRGDSAGPAVECDTREHGLVSE